MTLHDDPRFDPGARQAVAAQGLSHCCRARARTATISLLSKASRRSAAPRQTLTRSQIDGGLLPIRRVEQRWSKPLYARLVETRLREALTDTPVVAVTGPRQSGKTTLVRAVAGRELTYLTLDDDTTLAAARRDPVGFVRSLDRAVIDEAQRAPQLFLAIKKSVDEDRRPGRFLVTGSADLRTVPLLRDSLAGRMETIPLLPLARAEIEGRDAPGFLDQAFAGRLVPVGDALIGDELVAAVLAGGYPEVLARSSERRRRDWCRAYVDAIVGRDLPELAAVSRAGPMPQLLEVLALSAGQLVNLSQIGGRLGIDHKTVDRYLDLLERLFLLKRLPPWSRNELKRLVRTPKLHFIDTGLLAAVRGLGRDRLAADRTPFGALLESFVYAELLKQASWSETRPRFHHYRDKDGAEIDLVLEDEAGGVVGVEVKAAATVKASDFLGLGRLAAGAGPAFRLGVILYDGDLSVPFGERLFAAPLSALWAQADAAA